MKDEHEGTLASISRFLRRVPRQERARAVVDAILTAADESLHAVERGPLAPLMERAGVAVGSFYEYFASRDALIAAVLERRAQRNFALFLEDIDARTAGVSCFEEALRIGADVITRHYLGRLSHLRSEIRLLDRLGLLPRVVRERDRFAEAIAVRIERFTPELSPAARFAATRAMSDALTGLVIVSAFREPAPSLDEVALAAGDVAWGLAQVHLARTRRPGPSTTTSNDESG